MGCGRFTSSARIRCSPRTVRSDNATVVCSATSFSSVRLACCTRGVTKLGAKAETLLVTPWVNPAGSAQVAALSGQAHERVGIAGEDLVVVVVRVVEEDAGVGDAVIGLDDRVVNLRNADEEDAVSGADDEGTLVAEGVGESGARGEVIRLERNFAGWREQRVGDESCSSEGLQVPADAEIQRQVVGDADGVLCEGGVFVGVGMRGGAAEVLQIVMRDFMGVGAQRARVAGPLPWVRR